MYLRSNADNHLNYSFNDVVSEALFKSGISINNIGILKGLLLLEDLCRHLNSIEFDGKSMSIAPKIDEELYYSLLLNLSDSLVGSWKSFERSRFLKLCMGGRPYIECVVFTNITKDQAEKIDNQFCSLSYYIGAATMDSNNPLHSLLFYENLIYSIEVVNNEIQYIDFSDIEHWDTYYPNYSFEFQENLVFAKTKIDSWKNNISLNGLEAVKLLINKANYGHYYKVGNALFQAVLRGAIKDKVKINLDYSNENVDIIIPRGKLENYALNLEHSEGGPKAQYFKNVLGISQEDWMYMEEQIRIGLYEGEVNGIEIGEHGVKYFVNIGISGLNGVNKVIRTVWIIRPNEPVQLITLYPLDMKEQFEIDYSKRPSLTVSKEKSSEDKWLNLYNLANQVGESYSSECIPTPVFIKGVVEPMRDGLYGGAYVIFENIDHEFVFWLRANELGTLNEGRYLLHISVEGRAEKSIAFAEGICKVLRANSVACTLEEYLD